MNSHGWPFFWLLLLATFLIMRVACSRSIKKEHLFVVWILLLYLEVGDKFYLIPICLGALWLIRAAPRFLTTGLIFSPLILERVWLLFVPESKLGIGIFGISTYLSLSVYSYFRKPMATKSFVDFFVAVAFPPSLISGPVRNNFVAASRKTSIRKCLIIFLSGFVYKFLIHDNLSPIVVDVLDRFERLHTSELWMVLIVAKIFIYSSVIGYTSMVVGLAGVLGIKLELSFRKPFHQSNILAFWRGWQIPILQWIRDNIVLSLLGKLGRTKSLFGYLLVLYMTVALWHGFRWNFIIYGFLQALMMWTYMKWWRRVRFTLGRVINYLVFQILCISFPALLMLTHSTSQFLNFTARLFEVNDHRYHEQYFIIVGLVMLLVGFIEIFSFKLIQRLYRLNDYVFALVYTVIILVSIFFSAGVPSSFAYSSL